MVVDIIFKLPPSNMTELSRRNTFILIAATVILCGAGIILLTLNDFSFTSPKGASEPGTDTGLNQSIPLETTGNASSNSLKSTGNDSADDSESELKVVKVINPSKPHPSDSVKTSGGYKYPPDETGLSLAVKVFPPESETPGTALALSKDRTDSALKLDFENEEDIADIKGLLKDNGKNCGVSTTEVGTNQVHILYASSIDNNSNGVKDPVVLKNLAKFVSEGGNYDAEWVEFVKANVEYLEDDVFFFITVKPKKTTMWDRALKAVSAVNFF